MDDSRPSPSKNKLLGMFFMFLTGLCIVAVMVSIRSLDQNIPSIQAAFMRYCFGLLLILPLSINELKSGIVKIPLVKHAVRGTVHGFAVVLWFYSVANMPISDVTAINYLTPIFTIIGALILFKEKLTRQKCLGIIVAFGGAILILRKLGVLKK